MLSVRGVEGVPVVAIKAISAGVTYLFLQCGVVMPQGIDLRLQSCDVVHDGVKSLLLLPYSQPKSVLTSTQQTAPLISISKP